MKLSALDLNLLVAFDALHETRSVTRAAEKLGIGQPAMSAALARLRDIFHDELYIRANGAMQPTPKAKRLGPAVATALADLRTALDDNILFDERTLVRTFTIASTDYTTLLLLPSLIAAVRKRAQGVDVRVVGYDKGDIHQLIGGGEVDLALGVFRDLPERAVRTKLCEEFFIGVARAGHPAIEAGSMSLEAYAGQSHALVSVRRDAVGAIDAALANAGLSRRVALTVPHMLALPEIISISDMVCAVPNRLAERFGSSGLQTFRLPLDLAPWTIDMVWNGAARSDQAHGWLRKRLVDVASVV